MRLPKALAACVVSLLLLASVGALVVPRGREGAAASPAVYASKLLTGKGSSAASGGAGGLRAPAGVAFTGPPTTATGAPPASAPAPVSLPVPTAGSLPAVAASGGVHTPDAIVLFQSPLGVAD